MAKKTSVKKKSVISHQQPDGMDLSEFIEESLISIIIGVHSARQKVRNIASIMPGTVTVTDEDGSKFDEPVSGLKDI